jgi:hypothetical protein
MDFDMMTAMLEDQMAAADQARADALAFHADHLIAPTSVGGRRPGDAPARFNLLSLPAWLNVAQAAGLHTIPAIPLTTIPVETLHHAMDHRPNDPVVAAAHADAAAWGDALRRDLHHLHFNSLSTIDGWSYRARTILRFEQCAPGGMKAALSEGRSSLGWDPDAIRWDLVCDIWSSRFFDTLSDLCTDTVRPYARPYVPAAQQAAVFEGKAGSWPVEFRVFVRQGRAVGASAYYPQAALPDTWLPVARQAISEAQRLCDWMDSVQLGVGNARLCGDVGPGPHGHGAAWIPPHWGPQDFTLDFLVADTGTGTHSLMFLEAGPAAWTAAHPCCFQDQPWGTVDGIRLGLGQSTHPVVAP